MPNKKEDRRVTMSKNFLKEALITLLKEKQIHSIRIKEVCQIADVNRSTFYAHYQDIFSLLHEIENDIIAELSQALNSFNFNHTEAIIILENLIEFIGEKNEACQVLLSSNSHSLFEEKIRKIAQQFLLDKRPAISTIDENLFNYVSAYTISGSIELVKTWLEQDRDKEAIEIAQLIMTLSNTNIQ